MSGTVARATRLGGDLFGSGTASAMTLDDREDALLGVSGTARSTSVRPNGTVAGSSTGAASATALRGPLGSGEVCSAQPEAATTNANVDASARLGLPPTAEHPTQPAERATKPEVGGQMRGKADERAQAGRDIFETVGRSAVVAARV